MRSFANRQGLTLVELMIAVALIGIGIIAAAASFNGIHHAIQLSKGRMLATNIAQEKIQVLMQKSYYEVLVTTSPAYLVETSSTIAYDPGYFPPETLSEGGISFTRYTYIQVAQENSGAIRTLSPDTPDTGMRLIRETVVWKTDSGDRFLTIQNVLNNPATVMSNAVMAGTVKDAATNGAIPNALVNAAENIGWQDSADSTGHYSFTLSAGLFDFQASAPGYYSKIITLTAAPNTTTTQNFALTAISTGTIKGTAWVNNHIVISQVVASTGPANSFEYVELYNPSTATVLMGTNLTYATPSIWVAAYDAAGNVQSHPELFYMATAIASNGFFLIANTYDGSSTCGSFTINGVTVTPDACWRTASAPNHLLQCNPLSGGGGGCGGAPNAGGIVVGTNGGGLWSGALTALDAIAWRGAGTTPGVYETSPVSPASPTLGLIAGEEFIRRLDTTTALNATTGNAYDSNNNSVDFFDNTIPFAPRTSLNTYAPISGTPAPGALASVVDGLSIPSSATLAGSPPYAQFMVPGVATGTWTMFVDSGTSSAELDNISVVSVSTTNVGGVILSTSGVIGMVSGQVVDALGAALGGITVTAGTYSTTTGANGTYYLRMATGTYTVTANPNNMIPRYAVQALAGVTVNLADVTAPAPFALSTGGRINGWITRDGVNPLPSVTVVALDSNGGARDTEVTDPDGRFLLINLTTGTYTIQPVLDSKETSTPTSASVTVGPGATQWSSTFTVTGAMGTVVGNVTANSQPITTGVLVIVSTGGLTLPLPALSSSTLSSAVYYANSSKEDGTFSIDVRSSTSTLYTATALYMYLNNQTPVISSRTVSGITITGGTTTSGVNFSW